jgi:hypothetical protein
MTDRWLPRRGAKLPGLALQEHRTFKPPKLLPQLLHCESLFFAHFAQWRDTISFNNNCTGGASTTRFSLKFLTFAVGFDVFGRGFGVKSVVVATLYFLISNFPEMGVCSKLQVRDDLEWVRNKV